MAKELNEDIDSSLRLSNLYPNPVRNQLNVEFNMLKSGAMDFIIMDMSGKVAKEKDYTT